MKKIQFSFLALVLLGAVSCNKSNTSPAVSGNVSNAEAADIAASSLSSNSNGVANISDDATSTAQTMAVANATCGTVKSDTISRSSAPGAAYAYTYHSTYHYTVKCSSLNVPDSLLTNLAYSGSFSGPNLSSSNSGSSLFTVGGLGSASTAFVINGEHKRSGQFKSKIDTTNAGYSSTDIVITNLTLKKPSRMIESGSATISVTGNVPKEGNFSYTGTIVFNGDGTAKLTLNGTAYTINLFSGRRIRI
jgi:hypothetical protein